MRTLVVSAMMTPMVATKSMVTTETMVTSETMVTKIVVTESMMAAKQMSAMMPKPVVTVVSIYYNDCWG